MSCSLVRSDIYFYPRSPCGERLTLSVLTLTARYFYPRSPCGERRYLINTYHRIFGISIHALLAESDRRPLRDGHHPPISIHALLAESDARQAGQQQQHHNISIHALLAESDAVFGEGHNRDIDFYPRSPCGERLVMSENLTTQSIISIHALLAESDDRPPLINLIIRISIHALLAESDCFFCVKLLLQLIFLSTLSLRRATYYRRQGS